MKQRGLGRGLSALIGEDYPEEKQNVERNSEGISKNEANSSEYNSILDLRNITPSQDQPRKIFNDESLQELSASIKKHGVIQPIIVAPDQTQEGKYIIIAGERRWRAAKEAGLSQVPVVIKNIIGTKILEIAILENIQREDLTVIEEAEGYQKLIAEFGYTQEELAITLGKSRSHIANMLRLNNLSDFIKQKINLKELSMGHARCLVGVENADKIAQEIIDKGLNVRQAEVLVNSYKSPDLPQSKNSKPKTTENKGNEDLLQIQESLESALGLKVVIDEGKNGGKLSIFYHNLQQLDIILDKLSS